MRKVLVFSAILFVFGTFFAKTGTTESGRAETDSFYIQPVLAAGMIFGGERYISGSFNASLKTEFLVSQPGRITDIYVGADIGFKYNNSLYQTWDVPILFNVAFDFMTDSREGIPEHIGFWLAIGVACGKYDEDSVFDYDPGDPDKPYVQFDFAWAFGLEAKFRNRLVVQLSARSFAVGKVVPMAGIGYRF